jgi:pimeloyl-ACP methyl ester carboxylesterase
VIGHSFGGSVGLALAVRHPATVSKLMVVDMVPWMGAVFGPPGTVTPEMAGSIAERTRAAWETPGDEAWQRRITASINSMIRTESLRPRAIATGVASDRGVAARVMRDLILQDLRGDLARVTIPIRVLYVRGPHLPLDTTQIDAVFQSAYATTTAAGAAAPRVTLQRIPDAYHFIMLDQPARFADEVRAFLHP